MTKLKNHIVSVFYHFLVALFNYLYRKLVGHYGLSDSDTADSVFVCLYDDCDS